MAFCRLGAAVGGAVTAHHLGGAVPEQVLDIQLTRIVGDRPGGEGMPEAMGMDWGIPAARPSRRSNCLSPLGWSRTPGWSRP